jgi:hypothetical protein
MKRARRSVDLQSLGIDALRPKRAVTGGLLLEVLGQESGPKADRLAERLREALGEAGVTVARPVVTMHTLLLRDRIAVPAISHKIGRTTAEIKRQIKTICPTTNNRINNRLEPISRSGRRVI